jgi:Protein of unknown function (DUF2946)
MRTGLVHGSRKLNASILLIALAFRALVPAGFMPASDRLFSLEICPEGFPPQLLHHGTDHGSRVHHGASHSHNSAHSEHCVFAAVTGAGPGTLVNGVHAPLDSFLAPLFDTAPFALRTQRFRIQQPRAPPLPA